MTRPSAARWVDPANPRRIARTEAQGIGVSLDGGGTWVASHHLPIAEVARLAPRAQPAEPARHGVRLRAWQSRCRSPIRYGAGLIFAGTSAAVYVSFDDGAHWSSLQLNMPAVAINDLDIRGNNLIAATQGRSIWTLDDISPLRQIDAATASAAARLFKPADAVGAIGRRRVSRLLPWRCASRRGHARGARCRRARGAFRHERCARRCRSLAAGGASIAGRAWSSSRRLEPACRPAAVSASSLRAARANVVRRRAG